MNSCDLANDHVDLLIIGYGNQLRSDDGVGPRIGEAVADWKLPGVRALACHQLTPELADPISAAREVIFVDAAADASASVELREIQAAEVTGTMTHATDPRSLLRLAAQVFGRCPRAWWLTVPASRLGFGDELSDQARQGMRAALDKIRKMTGQ